MRKVTAGLPSDKPPAAPMQASIASPSGDTCPNCKTTMAADQRYCVECGQRRGDPRLPFMDAVVFMEAQRPREAAPPPPPPPAEHKQGLTANAALIAGIGTLVLAIGVGVLIGRSGSDGSTPVANTAPQVIQVGGGGETASTGKPTRKAATGEAKNDKKSSATAKAAAKKTEAGSSGATKATEAVFKPNPDVKLPPPTVQKGGKCESGAAGCQNGEFTGDFFGE